MYCSACGSPITPGLSFCNRCGVSLKERDEKPTSAINALVTAMVLVGIAGMGLLLGGPIALRREGQFAGDLIVLFMFLTFLIVGFTQIFLYRQLSRLTGTKSESQGRQIPPAMPAEFRASQPRALAEPVPSVTENTTRTLEYSREERGR